MWPIMLWMAAIFCVAWPTFMQSHATFFSGILHAQLITAPDPSLEQFFVAFFGRPYALSLLF